ncbi:hypothetical protein [Helicobacter sp. 11S03491-1]|uniref:hypothetical protein n=1 Tax=Helicobacter sp. 11S03491-1 TaxID=1476196 RepID=UPI000BA71CE0|nr:hypothetical protein [Helicobacter sp. 11S03491-1]PAF42984.1 hypothetical protein BKH45_02635 [Helicobacter sp. 11S03491-1]
MRVNVSSMGAHMTLMANTAFNIANTNNKQALTLNTNLIDNNRSVSALTTIAKHSPTPDTQIPNLIVGQKGIQANAVAIKSNDLVTRTLLDLKV